MKRVRFLAAASDELRRVALHYHSISPRVARAFLKEFDREYEFMRKFPHAGGEHPFIKGVLRRVLVRFRYDLVYQINQDEIVILAVAPHRRKPGYWANRIR